MRTAHEFEDPSQTDELDQLLYRMPWEPPPGELAATICYRVQMAHRRAIRARLSLSLLLAILGTWLALPSLVSRLEELSLPSSGLLYLYPLIQSTLNGLWGLTQDALAGMAAFQMNLAQTMDAGAWLGSIALASAALLALSAFMPQIEE